MTLAFWGGFRLGKLLLERRYEFDLMSCLLPSDIQFRGECVTLWLRNPKIGSRFGDLVELWKMEECKGIDGVSTLWHFLRRRKELFGEEDTLPVFVHEDGSNLTKEQMNKDLKKMLAIYPELAESRRDSWSGHSFRSGLSTMLQRLGFPKETIQAWGRWKLSAYLFYLKDRDARMEVRSNITDTQSRLLKLM